MKGMSLIALNALEELLLYVDWWENSSLNWFNDKALYINVRLWNKPEAILKYKLASHSSFYSPAATTAEPVSTGITGTAASVPQASLVQTVGSVSINPASHSSLIPVRVGPGRGIAAVPPNGRSSQPIICALGCGPGQAISVSLHRALLLSLGETGLAGQQLISHALWHWLHRLFSLLKAFRWPHSFPLQTLCSAKSSL